MSGSMGGAIRRYNHLEGEINAVYHRISLKLGLSDSAAIILYTICNSGDACPLRDICRLSGLSKQTVNSAMKKLENDGYIRLFNTNDRRSKQVSLTPKGMALAENTVDRIIEKETDALAGMAADEKETFLQLYQKYNNLLNTKMQTLTDSAGLSAKALEGE